MEPVQHRHLHTNMARMKPRSQSSITDQCLNLEHTIVWVMLSVDEAVLNAVVEEVNFKDLVDGVVEGGLNRADDGDQDSVVDDLDGRIMINRNVFVMQVFKSNRSGNYLRKLSSIGCLS